MPLCKVVWLLLIFSVIARAQTADTAYTWSNVIVGDGGFIPTIVFSRAEPGLAYARCDIGGLYRWDARRARWLALQDAMSESSYFGVESVGPDPLDANVVYAAVGMYRRGHSPFTRWIMSAPRFSSAMTAARNSLRHQPPGCSTISTPSNP